MELKMVTHLKEAIFKIITELKDRVENFSKIEFVRKNTSDTIFCSLGLSFPQM